ncbi:calcium-dependent phosphotriesterase [Setomelanomma holmii]|uniref:Calcium-dependent phosphotriesterase n=1 Tax=Setomelanomma holmii TaxID=210430 RepID=A0A9P4HCV5_9PLEO|nr:calcium-dependent phosphotriesterase [Setomelanomma holmii]
MAILRRAITIALLALASPWVYDRYLGFSNMFTNRPGSLVEINTFKSLDVKFTDTIKNCEDVVLVEDKGVALLSCDPGRDRWNTVMGTFTKDDGLNTGSGIWIYDYSTTDSLTRITLANFPSAHDFHPLGLDLDESTSTLYIVNHARSGLAIELFHLAINTATATHIRTFTHPLLHAPNAVEPLGNGKLYVTNDHLITASTSQVLSKLETFSGLPGGSVVYIDLAAPEESKTVARVPFANGVVRLNTSHLAVASSSKAGVYIYAVQPDHSLTFEKLIRTPSSVDNLSVDSAGTLLMAGHPFAPQLMKVAEKRPGCVENGSAEEKEVCGCDAPSWASEWSEKTGLMTLLVSSGVGEEALCSSSTVVRDVGRGVGIVGMLYGRGIGVFRV